MVLQELEKFKLGSAIAWGGKCYCQGEEASLDDVRMDHKWTGNHPEGASPFFLLQPCSLPPAILSAELTWGQKCGLENPSPYITKLRMDGPLGIERQSLHERSWSALFVYLAWIGTLYTNFKFYTTTKQLGVSA